MGMQGAQASKSGSAWNRPGLRLVEPALVFLHPAHRLADKDGPRFEPQLSLDVAAVCLNGLEADMEFLGDLAVFAPYSDAVKDLEFTGRKANHGRFGKNGFQAEQLPRNLLGDCVAQVQPSEKNVVERVDDAAGRLPLHNIAERAGPNRPLGIVRLVMHREDQDRRWVRQRFQALYQFKAGLYPER